ncbi:MAG: flagellar hook assembly protein FlgD [Deltaproteobacteria bacterium]|jgi:flagellar basal-body rod modification protein FlgD|nr:flagellar hook assembly protein FlgD [Deltaproteobacteria bacterium]
MSAVSSILGQAEAAAATQGASRTESDKDMFLKLLVAQLTHQDPLNPVEDKEFIAQLAQFTSVEELQKISGGMTQMNESYERAQLNSAASLLGMRVISQGSSVSKMTNEETGDMLVMPIYYTSDVPLSSCVVSVLNPDTGQIVYSEELGARLAGDYSFEWSGKNNAGAYAPDGVYEISFIAADDNGKRVLIDTQVYGDVVRVEQDEGMYYLRLSDGRRVKYVDVNTVGYVQYSNSPSEESSGDGSGDGSG